MLTTCATNSTFCLHSVFVFFVPVLEQTSIVFLLSTNWFVFRRVHKITKSNYRISLDMSARPSVCPLGTRLPLNEFSWNFIFLHPSKFCPEYSSLIKFRQVQRVLYVKTFSHLTLSRWIFIRMRNVLHKSCWENKKTTFNVQSFFPKIRPFMR